MNAGRVVLALTSLVIAGLGGWLAIARWEQANRVAAIVSAIAAVAAVGVAIWAVLRPSKDSAGLTVSNTGDARARTRGNANTGVSGHIVKHEGSIHVANTGNANADDGDANTGVKFS